MKPFLKGIFVVQFTLVGCVSTNKADSTKNSVSRTPQAVKSVTIEECYKRDYNACLENQYSFMGMCYFDFDHKDTQLGSIYEMRLPPAERAVAEQHECFPLHTVSYEAERKRQKAYDAREQAERKYRKVQADLERAKAEYSQSVHRWENASDNFKQCLSKTTTRYPLAN